MRAALVRVDGVRVGVDALRVGGGPLHRDLEADLLDRVLGLEGDDVGVDDLGLLRLHEVLHVVDEAPLVEELLGAVLGAVHLALVVQRERQALVEERHLLEARAEGVVVELDGLEDLAARPEGDGRAGLGGSLALLERCVRHADGEALAPHGALAADLDVEALGQRVHDGAADAVQAAGHRVSAAAELAAGVQLGEDELDRGDPLDGVDVDRDAAAVVDDADPAVLAHGDLDVAGEPGEVLVDGVVDDLAHQVVQTARSRGPDVHAGALAHCLEALEHLDLVGAVVVAHLLAGDVVGVVVRLLDLHLVGGGVVGEVLCGIRCHEVVAPAASTRPCPTADARGSRDDPGTVVPGLRATPHSIAVVGSAPLYPAR